MGKVYVVQVPQRRDEGGTLRPTVDISSASEFGELSEPMFAHFGVQYYTQNDVHAVRKLLKDYCDDDSVLAVGDPAAIGISIALAAESNRGKVAVLRWDRKRKSYMRLKFDLRG